LFSRLLTERARLFENPSETPGVEKVELAEFSRLFCSIWSRKWAGVELRSSERVVTAAGGIDGGIHEDGGPGATTVPDR
jgi:hypothetical protein